MASLSSVLLWPTKAKLPFLISSPSHRQNLSIHTNKTRRENNNNNNNKTIKSNNFNRSSSVIVRAAATTEFATGENIGPSHGGVVRRVLEGLEVGPGKPAGIALITSLHLLCLFAPFCYSKDAFGVMGWLGIMTGLGVTLLYHRNLSHKSFKLPKWLEYFFAYCGAHACQGDPIGWVRNHRYHHQYPDLEKDPHSPILEGVWYGHMGWIYDSNTAKERSKWPSNVEDLECQPFYQFIRHTYIFHILALATLLYAIGGFPYIVWGMGVRTILTYHITFFVSSVCHSTWGNQIWKTDDHSKNSWIVGFLALGEGWHNNHHAFEYSARHGLEWWQVDFTWYVIKTLQILGLATDVKLPTQAQIKRRMALNSKIIEKEEMMMSLN